MLWVALGGALGAVLRFSVSKGVAAFAINLPLATLFVNVLGSFLMGLLAASLISDQKMIPEARLLFQTGLLGAFTTFSAFSLETLQLWQSGQSKMAIVNVAANVILSLLAVTLGLMAGSAMAAR